MDDSDRGFQGIIGECFEECGVNNVSDNL